MSRTGARKAGPTAAVEPLDRGSPIPLYVQVRNRLLALVSAWTDPQRNFPSDDELTRTFAVSRATIREAMEELVEAGFLHRTRGSGTKVSLHKVEEKLTPRMDIRRQWAAEGQPIHATVLAFERVGAPAEVARRLDLAPGAEILFIKRVRSTPISPVAIDWRYVPARHAKEFTRAEASGSILDALWTRVPLHHSDLQIEAALSGIDEVELLHLPAGSPVLVRNLVYFDRAARPVMTGRSIHRADLMRYSLQIELRRGGGPVRTMRAARKD
jgi:GntR family transcriptional regulator